MTSERIGSLDSFSTREKYLLYLRHLFAYEFTKGMIQSTDMVLDVGCGLGYGASILGKAAVHVLGLDTNATVVTEATQEYGRSDVLFRQYDGINIPTQDSYYDIVVAFHLLEHIKDDAVFVGELYRVLRPGGFLLLTTPNRVYRLKPGQRPWNQFHVREYDAQGLKDTLGKVFHPDNIGMLGICGTPEVQEMEHRRVAWALRDGPLSAIRRAIPDSVKAAISVVLGLFCHRSLDFLVRHGVDDFHTVAENVTDGLDLMAMCRKP